MTPKIYQLSTFRPEQCGIASWTEDTINYCHKVDPSLPNRVIAVNGFRSKSEYGDFVDFCIDRDDEEEYVRAAEFVNQNSGIELVNIQHEYGIFGGERINGHAIGNYVLSFLDTLEKPKMITCHTVPSQRTAQDTKLFSRRKEVLTQILGKVDKGIVISNVAKDILVNEYGTDPEKLEVILHGTHDFDESYEDSRSILGLEGKFVVSMVGLVRKKRGIEQVIRALQPVVEVEPNFVYVIAGKTHPKEIIDGEEPYRDYLKKEVARLGLEDHVMFVNRYLPLASLLRFIQASDVCITPYTDPRQISSGVLSYNVGLEKPVISTPFLYAKEILAEGRGVVLPDFDNPESISKAIIDLIEHPEKIKIIKENIRPFKGQMNWMNVAKRYVDIEKQVISEFLN